MTRVASTDTAVRALVARGALFVVSHSGGKDSQAMLAIVRRQVPARQLLVVHADLHEVEWPGTLEHARQTSGALPFVVAKAVDKHGRPKSLFDLVDSRPSPMWPTPQQRQCTSDLKRGPIEKVVRHYLKAHPEFNGLVVSCMGLRAEESSCRKKACQRTLTRDARNSKAGREWWVWLPVAELTTAEVFETIRAAGQEPHYAYALGATRLSCAFCIMASVHDLRVAARHLPVLYMRYVEHEKRIGHTLAMSGEGLEARTGIRARRLPILTE
jgi:3'-phosphoadenosine 5'-phosphosulfate sulfotransferase (PAPS reductase)/FAD synthetase